MIRNSIDIDGVISEFELSNLNLDNVHTFQDNNTFNLDKLNCDSIIHISVDCKTTDIKTINLNDKMALIINGETFLKMLASDLNNNKNVFNHNKNISFSSCITIPTVEIDYVEVFLIDAFFNLINSNTCYYSFTYLIQVNDHDNLSIDFNEFDVVSNSLNIKNNYKLIDMEREFF